MLKLTREQRRAIMAKRHPKIAGGGECPVCPGAVIELTSRVSIRVDRVRIPRGGGWSLAYTRRDFRDLYLMPSGHRRDLDERGRPKPMSEAEEHGLTTDPRDLIDAGSVLVGADYQTVVGMPSRLRRAGASSESERQAQARALRERLRRTMDGLSPDNQVALLAALERALAQIREQEEKGAA